MPHDPRTSRVLRAPIPATRDPFINTPLLHLTPDPRTGAERFWISTCNFNVGCTAALITEHGEARIYRLGLPHACFYSAAQEDDDTLWLCGWLTHVARLTLSTGEIQLFETGAPGALNFQGMVLDHTTGKLFAAAFPPPRTVGFSFDFRAKRPGRVQDLPTRGHYARFSFPNGDGTWSLVMALPGDHVVIWDPRTEAVEGVTMNATMMPEDQTTTTHALVADERGRRYFPRTGWYDPATRRVEDGPCPQREMTWFARHNGEAVGVSVENAQATVGAWDLVSGRVRDVCRIPDAVPTSVNLTSGGKVVAVNVYGVFFRFDLTTGAMECSRVLGTDAVGSADCLCRLDSQRVLGTPYITQRFWEVNLDTKRGSDLGRAAPGAGEIMKLCKAAGHVYLAAYTGAELMEYDPAHPARFPENPRVVADAPLGMRPVAMATDGTIVWYACSHEYGTLGSVLTRYDAATGLARYASYPLGDQQIQSIVYDARSNALLCGTTIHADCQSCPPTEKLGKLARLRADELSVLKSVDAPAGSEWAAVVGPVGAGRWLCLCNPPGRGLEWFTVNDELNAPSGQGPRPVPEGSSSQVLYAGRPGRVVLVVKNRIELWDFNGADAVRERVLHEGDEPRLVAVDGEDVLFTTPTEVGVIERCLV